MKDNRPVSTVDMDHMGFQLCTPSAPGVRLEPAAGANPNEEATRCQTGQAGRVTSG
jgi:hypothetical protein